MNNGIAHLDQYLGPWAMREDTFTAMLERVNAMDLPAHIEQAVRLEGFPEPDRSDTYELTADGIAVIEMVGTMTKYGSSLSEYPGSVTMRRRMRKAVADERVRGIVLRIDSPGGSVSGTGDLADEVRNASLAKPVVAYIEDIGASAAYAVASQASQIVAGPDAIVGSIGTYMVIYDYSAQAAKAGIKAIVVRAGRMKGAGTPGTEITEEQLAVFQREIDEVNAQFLKRVMRGRGMGIEQVTKLATGEVWVGDYARALGLVDKVQSLDAAIGDMRHDLGKRSGRIPRAAAAIGGNLMASTTVAEGVAPESERPRAATLPELKALDGSTAEQQIGWLERGITLAEATREHLAALKHKLDAQAQEIATAKTEAAKAAAGGPRPGLPALVDGGKRGQASTHAAGDDPIDAFNAAVKERMAGGLDRWAATKAVVNADPELHAEYLSAVQAQCPSGRSRGSDVSRVVRV